MKTLRRTVIGIVGGLLPLVYAGSALAQDGNETPLLNTLLVPAQLAVRLSILINELLGFWVTPNYDLSDPLGEDLISGFSIIIPRLVDFWAQLLSLF